MKLNFSLEGIVLKISLADMALRIPDIPCSIVWDSVKLFTINFNNNHGEGTFLR
jgi:hypothetical protein